MGTIQRCQLVRSGGGRKGEGKRSCVPLPQGKENIRKKRKGAVVSFAFSAGKRREGREPTFGRGVSSFFEQGGGGGSGGNFFVFRR